MVVTGIIVIIFAIILLSNFAKEDKDDVTNTTAIEKHTLTHEENKIRTTTISPDLSNIMQEYISDFLNKQNLPYVVTPSIPIVWFGDMEEYNKSPTKIVTVGLNPSLDEFTEKRFDIIDLKRSDATDKLARTLNLYFKDNPYMRWFDGFERVISMLDASYKENKATNTAIHIDIYSAIATNPKWSGLLPNEKKDLQRIDLFKKLLNHLNPDIILFSVNKEVFDDVFYQYKLEKSVENIGGKPGIFIRKYSYLNKILISGRNMKGTPFGGLSNDNLQETMKEIIEVDTDIKIDKFENNSPAVIAKSQPENSSDKAIWYKNIENYVSNFSGYACKDAKQKYLIACLDILRIENRPMTVDEVREKCFNNFDKYGIDRYGYYLSKSNSEIINECLYQHANCNHNENAEKHYKFFVRDNLKRYALDPNIKLW